MTPDQVRSAYQRGLRERVTVRRYTSVGTSRTYAEAANCRARITGYAPDELVSGILQGDRRVILYADDVAAGGISEIKNSDKIIQRGRELSIVGVDNSTRRVDDELIAYELQCRG